MFVDTATVIMKAGDGGDGIVSFRHEKFVDRGGPDGGDGGDGGDIILCAGRNQNTLANFRYKKELKAPDGNNGSKNRKHGKNGQNLIVLVPEGTSVLNEANEILADLTTDGQQAIIAAGGKGGFGNAHFVSSRRQAPKIAEKGEKGAVLQVTLELKMIADVGLVGLPNAGKSTLLAGVSNARPAIANYPFTTLKPNLGVVEVDRQTSLLFADIPGLIEGASHGKGLGDDFLRHVERTSVLVHLIDVYEDVARAYTTIQNELKHYSVDLTKRPQIVVLNKIDGVDEKQIASQLVALKKVIKHGSKLHAISAQSKTGVQELLFVLKKVIQTQRAKQPKKREKETIPILRLPESDDGWNVAVIDNGFIVTGKKIERFAARTDFENEAGVQRLRNIMRKMGIMHELERQKIKPGQKITIGSSSLLTY